MNTNYLGLVVFPACLAGFAAAAEPPRPLSDYRYHDNLVKLERLSDKGLTYEAVRPSRPIAFGRPRPPVPFANAGRKPGQAGSIQREIVPVELLEEQGVARCCENFLQQRDKDRCFGYFNYGDWYGERGRNWGNNEYDFAHGFFLQFARTGNRDYFRVALAAARHQADVDCVHAYPDPYFVGANHEHSIGHTGTWSEKPPLATWSFPYGHGTAADNGHTWSEGMVEAWPHVLPDDHAGGRVKPRGNAIFLAIAEAALGAVVHSGSSGNGKGIAQQMNFTSDLLAILQPWHAAHDADQGKNVLSGGRDDMARYLAKTHDARQHSVRGPDKKVFVVVPRGPRKTTLHDAFA